MIIMIPILSTPIRKEESVMMLIKSFKFLYKNVFIMQIFLGSCAEEED
jgi:hypothetical protein